MSRRPGKESLSKKQVIEAAIAIASEKGMDHLNLKDVAERLGIRSPSLYNHIAGLRELKDEVAIVAVRMLGETLQISLTGRSGERALREMMQAYRSYAKRNPELYSVVQKVLDGSERLQEEAAKVLALISLLFTGIKKEEQIHRIRIIRSLLHGFIELERTGGFALPEKLDQTFERIKSLAVTLLPESSSRG